MMLIDFYFSAAIPRGQNSSKKMGKEEEKKKNMPLLFFSRTNFLEEYPMLFLCREREGATTKRCSMENSDQGGGGREHTKRGKETSVEEMRKKRNQQIRHRCDIGSKCQRDPTRTLISQKKGEKKIRLCHSAWTGAKK